MLFKTTIIVDTKPHCMRKDGNELHVREERPIDPEEYILPPTGRI
jgi:hypothetical protein